MNEAFVYCWTDHLTNKIYIGSHKGSIDDGYICSSKFMLQEYKKRQSDFTRQILAEGLYDDIRAFEAAILLASDAKNDRNFYNMTNGDKNWVLKFHTDETRKKISVNSIGKKHTELTKKKLQKLNSGVNHNRFGKYGKENPCSKMYEFIDPNGKIYLIKGMRSFCEKNNLNVGNMSRVVSGHRKHVQNWKCREIA